MKRPHLPLDVQWDSADGVGALFSGGACSDSLASLAMPLGALGAAASAAAHREAGCFIVVGEVLPAIAEARIRISCVGCSVGEVVEQVHPVVLRPRSIEADAVDAVIQVVGVLTDTADARAGAVVSEVRVGERWVGACPRSGEQIDVSESIVNGDRQARTRCGDRAGRDAECSNEQTACDQNPEKSSLHG